MCCGSGNTIKPSQVIKNQEAKKKEAETAPVPQPENFTIDPRVKADLIRQQQILRIKKP